MPQQGHGVFLEGAQRNNVFTEADTKKLLKRGEKNMMNVLKRAVIATVSVMMTAGFALGVSAEEKVKLVLVKGQSATGQPRSSGVYMTTRRFSWFDLWVDWVMIASPTR